MTITHTSVLVVFEMLMFDVEILILNVEMVMFDVKMLRLDICAVLRPI